MKLKINIAFSDKHNGKKYVVGEEVDFAEYRAKELLADERKLVSKVDEAEAVEEVVEEEKPKRKSTKKA